MVSYDMCLNKNIFLFFYVNEVNIANFWSW